MATELAWACDTSRVNGGGAVAAEKARYILWYIKAFLTGQIGGATTGLWTLAGSSDGATAGLDATDRLTNAFDNTKWVRAAAGTAHSWFVLSGPTQDNGSTLRLIVDYSSASGDHFVNIVFGRGALSGGTTLNRPTVASELTAYTSLQITDATTVAHKVHGRLSASGDFWILSSKDGSGRFWWALSHGLTIDNQAANPNKAWIFATYAASGDLVTELAASFGASGKAWSQLSTVGTLLNTHPYNIGVGQALMDSAGGDPDASGESPMWRIYPSDLAAGVYREKGRLPDVFWCHTARTDGNTTPAAGTPEYMAVGKIWIPTDAVPAL